MTDEKKLGKGTDQDPYPSCIKCNKELSPQDSMGWERIETYQTDGGKGPEIWLCPECILNSQVVKDKYGGTRCEKCNKLFIDIDEEYFKCVLENSPHPTQHFVCFNCFETYILTTAG